MKKEITWTNRYSQDDTPDKHGRWARVGYYNQITIAWISKVTGDVGIKYVAKPFFPTIANDSPFEYAVKDTEQDAKDYIETKFNELKSKLV
jgi:hypothetical protein